MARVTDAEVLLELHLHTSSDSDDNTITTTPLRTA